MSFSLLPAFPECVLPVVVLRSRRRATISWDSSSEWWRWVLQVVVHHHRAPPARVNPGQVALCWPAFFRSSTTDERIFLCQCCMRSSSPGSRRRQDNFETPACPVAESAAPSLDGRASLTAVAGRQPNPATGTRWGIELADGAFEKSHQTIHLHRKGTDGFARCRWTRGAAIHNIVTAWP